MDTQKSQFNFLLIMLVGAFILSFFIFRPFIYALALALIFAVVFYPLNQRLLKLFRGPGLASLLTTFVFILFILIPLVLFGTQVFKEARQLYSFLTTGGEKEIILNLFRDATDKIQQFLPGANEISFDPNQYLKQGAAWLIQNFAAIFSNFAGALLNFFIFIVAFYYLLKDGQKLKKIIIDVSPLTDIEKETILNKLKLSVNSVIKGNLVIAVIQGILTSMGLTIFGVPNAILWGMAAAITSLIPGIGTSLVILPAILYLFLKGQPVNAAGLIIWGVVAVGLIDNFLGPRLIGKGMRLHPLLVILAVLGGAAFFGPIGFLLGPLTLSLFLTLFDIYFYLAKQSAT